MYELKHSAKGTHWSKKDHKYVKKENGKYYYKDDMKQKQIDEKDEKTEDEMITAQAAKMAEEALNKMGRSSILEKEAFENLKSQYREDLYYKKYKKPTPEDAEYEKNKRKTNTQNKRLNEASPGKTVIRTYKLDGSSPDATKWHDFLDKKNKEKVVKQAIKDIKSSKSVREGLDILKNATKKTKSKKVTLSLDDRAKQMAFQEMEKQNYPKAPDFFNHLYDKYKKQLIEEEHKKK